jgi:hypothetical protein
MISHVYFVALLVNLDFHVKLFNKIGNILDQMKTTNLRWLNNYFTESFLNPWGPNFCTLLRSYWVFFFF